MMKYMNYKAVEIEAPEGYDLPENEEDKTYYFGIDENRQEETAFSLNWSRTFSATRPVTLKDMVKDNEGNFVAVGSFSGDLDISETTVLSKGYADGLIVKFNQDGNIIWYKTIAGNGNDKLLSVANCPDGGYVVAGYTDSDNLYYSNATDSITNVKFGLEDAFFVKINEEGSFDFCKVIGGVRNR